MAKPRKRSAEKLLADNLDLAHWVVRRCFPDVQPNTADWDEHHAQALEGVYEATLKYDPTKCSAFTTFAVCVAYRSVLKWRWKESRRGLHGISLQKFRDVKMRIGELPDTLQTSDDLSTLVDFDHLEAVKGKVQAMGSPYREVFQHEFWGPKLAYHELKRLANGYGFEGVAEFVTEIVAEGREVLCEMESE